MKATILDLLPKQGGANNRVDWENSVGGLIPFVYGEVKGVLKLLDYEITHTSDKRMLVEYEGRQTWVHTASLRRCELKKVVGIPRKRRQAKPKPTEFSRGQVFKDSKRHIKLLKEGYKMMGNYKVRGFAYECQVCGHRGFKPIRQIRVGSGCSNRMCRYKINR